MGRMSKTVLRILSTNVDVDLANLYGVLPCFWPFIMCSLKTALTQQREDAPEARYINTSQVEIR